MPGTPRRVYMGVGAVAVVGAAVVVAAASRGEAAPQAVPAKRRYGTLGVSIGHIKP